MVTDLVPLARYTVFLLHFRKTATENITFGRVVCYDSIHFTANLMIFSQFAENDHSKIPKSFCLACFLLCSTSYCTKNRRNKNTAITRSQDLSALGLQRAISVKDCLLFRVEKYFWGVWSSAHEHSKKVSKIALIKINQKITWEDTDGDVVVREFEGVQIKPSGDQSDTKLIE